MHNKIVTLEALEKICEEKRKENNKIVHCHGYFDLLHIGHIRHFNQASKMGDVFVVTIACDKNDNRGLRKPVFPENFRAEAVASLSDIDYVAIVYEDDLETILRRLAPNIYVKGPDYKHPDVAKEKILTKEDEICKKLNIELVLTKEIYFDSTVPINYFLSSFSDQLKEYIQLFRNRFSTKDIFGVIDKMSKLSVAVIGDAIIDDYRYCMTLGTSSKDPILSVRYQSKDIFAGGTVAIANHVAKFAKNVGMYTIVGEHDDYRSFIESKLNANIKPSFIVKPNAPTVLKRRFIEAYSLTKLFEVYIMDDSNLGDEQDALFRNKLKDELPQYDLVIVADFGHGAISKLTRDTIVDHSSFLAVNTQANSGNFGFNTISQYSKANYISLAERELRLEVRDLVSDLGAITDHIGSRLNADIFAVTRGKKGSLIRNRHGEKITVPAFTPKVVDNVGSGDAFLSVTAMAGFLGCHPELLGFIGNATGALAVEILGNRKSINPEVLKKYIQDLFS